MTFVNSYNNEIRAQAYAELEFPGTYYLAYRDLPDIISRYVSGNMALDFGCGTGRSTRFLRDMGFDVTGVDIARDMIEKARFKDPDGRYILVTNGELGFEGGKKYDLILSVFTFDNIPTFQKKAELFNAMAHVLSPTGKIVHLCSSPDVYVHEWASFSTKDYPENRHAKSGDKVKIIITEIDDKRPVEDIMWSHDDYCRVFQNAELEIVDSHKPLGHPHEPFEWIHETELSPWVIYVLGKSS